MEEEILEANLKYKMADTIDQVFDKETNPALSKITFKNSDTHLLLEHLFNQLERVEMRLDE